jgi:hypothetical protein
MMKRTIAIAAVLYLVPHAASADGRMNFRVDFNRTDVPGVYHDVGLNWQGIEFEIEKEFTKSKVVLSGFSIGIRRELFYAFTGFGGVKDVHRWDEGTYLSLRLFRNFDLSSNRAWSIGPSFAVLYGIPGTTLDRTIGAQSGTGAYDYTHIFPMRNSDVPKLLAEKAELVSNSGLLYPEASIALRRRLAKGGITLDWIGGIRIIRFGVVDSNAQGDVFNEKQVFIPSVGMRIGFKIF